MADAKHPQSSIASLFGKPLRGFIVLGLLFTAAISVLVVVPIALGWLTSSPIVAVVWVAAAGLFFAAIGYSLHSRRYRCTLKEILLVSAMLCTVACWLGMQMRWIQMRHAAIEWVESRHGAVDYGEPDPKSPFALRVLGEPGVSGIKLYTSDKAAEDEVNQWKPVIGRLFPEAVFVDVDYFGPPVRIDPAP